LLAILAYLHVCMHGHSVDHEKFVVKKVVYMSVCVCVCESHGMNHSVRKIIAIAIFQVNTLRYIATVNYLQACLYNTDGYAC